MKILELNNLIGSELGLYDSGSANQPSVVADRVIDVSDLCPKSEQCVIKYATVLRGRIAQICDWYKKGEDLGGTVHYFISEMTPESLASDVVFFRRCILMGVSYPYDLARVIFANQPTPHTPAVDTVREKR